MYFKVGVVLAVALSVLCLSGCVESAPERGKAKRAMGIAPQAEYPPLADYRLTLRHIGPRIMKCGEGGRITFALRNVDNKSLRLIEWYSNEPDNVVVSCQPWFTGMSEPDDSAWTELSFDVKMPPIRYPLELMPGNQVSVTKVLPFVDKLSISPGAERRFFIKARLNLKSVTVSSPVSVLTVRPADPAPPTSGTADGKAAR